MKGAGPPPPPALLQTEQCIGSPYKQRENAGLMTMQMPAAHKFRSPTKLTPG